MARLLPLLALTLLPFLFGTARAWQAVSALSGQVVDPQGPVAGAKVHFQGLMPSIMTDAKGQFQLPTTTKKTERVTAWKKGYLIAATSVAAPLLRLTLLPLPTEDNEEYEWLDPTPNPKQPNNCGNCHSQIYQEWHGSAHGQSAKNPRLLSLFGGTDWHGKPSPKWNVVGEHPLGSGVCATCHAPTFRDPDLDYDLRKVSGVAAHGVHCDYCHKIVEAPTDKLGHRFGRDGLNLLRPKGKQQLFFGPLDDAFREGEDFGYAPLYKESRYCASCHEGVVFGVHVYGTYSEWLKSPAKQKGQQCQDCHTKPTGHMTNLAPGKGGIERDPLTLGSHHFPGGTADLLRQCLQVQLQLQVAPEKIKATVTVSAQQVGHRVPTGFIDRNLVLLVEALTQDGKPATALAGPKLPAAAGKKLAGKAGFLYAKQLHSPAGTTPIPFWLPHGKIVDTRLHPEQPDQQHFYFAPEAKQFRVRLLYRRFWPEVAASKSWPEDELVVLDKTWK